MKKILLLFLTVLALCDIVSAQAHTMYLELTNWVGAPAVPDKADFDISFVIYNPTAPTKPIGPLTIDNGIYYDAGAAEGLDGFWVLVEVGELGAMTEKWDVGWKFDLKFEQKNSGGVVIATYLLSENLPQQYESFWTPQDDDLEEDPNPRPGISLGTDQPDISISLSPTTLAYCEGVTGGNVTAAIANSSNYSLTWKEGATDLVGNGLTLSGANNTVATVDVSKFTAGAHTVTVTATDNTTSKTATADFTLTINPKPTVSLAIDQTAVCEKTSVNLTATANIASGGTIASYTWADKTGFQPLTGSSSISAIPQTANSDYIYEVTVTSDKGCTATDSDTLTVNAAPNVPALSAIPVVCEGNTVNLAACVPADPAIARYDYYKGTFPAGTPVADPTQIAVGGAYYIIGVGVAPTNCLSAAKPATIQINPLPNVKLVANNNDTIICAGESVTLTASGNATTYVWGAPLSGTGLTQTVTPVSTTTYTVTGTTGACSKTVSREIKVNPLPTIAMTAQVGGVGVTDVCPGTTVTLTADGKDNNSPIITDADYVWTGGVTGNGLTKTVTPTGATTTYNVEVSTIAGCKASVSKTINVYTPEVITLTPSRSVCATEATTTGVVLTATGLTGPGSSYSWTDGGGFTGTGTTQTVKPSVTTVYTVNGIDVHGCVAAAVNTTITVDPMPVLTLVKTDLQSCSDVFLSSAINTTVNPSGTTYEYATDMAFTSPISLNAATKVGAGTYFLRAKNGTCVTDVTNAHKVTVTILSSPTLEVEPSLAACSPGTVDLTSAMKTTNCSAITYWKSDKVTGITPTDAQSIGITGVYYIKGTLGDCPALFRPVQVNINPTPDVKVNDFAYCASTKGNLTAASVTAGSTAGLVYTYWASGAGRVPVATPATVNAGRYKIVGTTAAGCADSAEVVVTENPLPVIATITLDQDACSSTELTVAATATGKATLTYAWSAKGGGSITSANPNQSSVTAKTAATGTLNHFVVKVTDGNNCSVSDTVKVTGHKVTPGTIAALPGSVIPCGSAVNLTVNGAKCSETGCAVTYEWRPSAQIASSSTVSATSTNINSDTRFSVKVEDAHGCFDTAFIDITVKGCNFKFDPTMAMVDSICSGLTKNLTAKVTGTDGEIPTFAWSEIVPGTGLQAPTNVATVSLNTAGLTAGQVYKYEITASCFAAGQNVTRKDTVEVYIRPLPTFKRTLDSWACAKADVPLVTNVTGGTLKPGDSYAYAWSIAGQGSYKTLPGNAATATGVMADAGGLNGFAVKVSDSYQCASYDTVKMTGHKIIKGAIVPSIGTLVTKGTAQNLVLSGESCSEGDTPLTYTWGPTAALVTPAAGNTVTTIGLQSTTNFYVEIKDVNNCFDTAKVSVAVGTLAIDVKADTVCAYLAGDTDIRSFEVTQPTGGSYSYAWSPIVGMSQSAFTLTDQTTSKAKVDIKSLAAGVYVAEVQVTQTSPLLTFKDTAYLLIRPLPTFDVTSDSWACAKADVPLNVTNVTGGALKPGDSYTYAWSIAGQGSYKTLPGNAATATGVMADAGGVNGFAVKVSDSYQCASYDTVKMTGHKVNPGLITGKTPIAAGTAQILTVSGAACSEGNMPLTYTWGPVDSLVTPSTGAGLTSVTTKAIAGNTEFFVEVRDANNCFDTAKYQVNVGNLKLLTTADTLCATGATTTASFKVINPASGAKLTYAWTAIPSLSTTAFTITSANQPTTTANVTGAGVCVAEVKLIDTESGLTLLDTAYIKIHPAPALAIAGTGSGCVGTTVNDMTATVTVGTAPLTYAWSGGLSAVKNPDAPIAVPGDNVYALTVTDANGCQAMASHTIVGHQVLVSGTANPGVILVSGVSNLKAVATATPATSAGELKYSWSPATGLNTTTGSQVQATLSASQNYMVTVTDGNNCSAVASVRVNVLNETLAVTADDISGCANEVLKLNARATGGTGSYRYTWSFTDPNLKLSDINSSTPVVLASTPAGVYNLTVLVNDGKNVKPSATITVTKKALPTLTVGQSLVSGGVYDLTATVNPGSATCTWSPAGMLNGVNTGATVRTVDLTVSQAYTVKAIQDGCSASLPVLVNVSGSPMNVLASAEPGCVNEEIFLNASATGGDGDAANYTYTWKPGAGLTLSQTNIASPKVVSTVPGTYSATVTVSDKAGKSATSNVVTVIVYPKPEVTVNTNAFACQNSEITLTAGGADTYTWLQGVNGTGAVKTAILAGTTLYQVVGASANGCRDTADYTVTMRNLPAVSVNVASDVCTGAEVTLSATPDIATNTYTWTGGMTGATVKTTVATPGAVNFTVTVRDADGCINSATKSVTAHAVKVTAAATLNADKSASLTATPEFFPAGQGGTPLYIWKDAAKLIAANVQNPTTVVLTQAETFMVTLKDAHGCVDSSEVMVNVTGDGTILAATPGNVAGCAYDTLTLNANATGGDGSYEYTWLRGPGLTLSDTTLAMPEVWTSTPGTYMATVKVKSAGKEVTSAAVSIKIFAKPTVNVPMPAAICSGTDITMTASGASQYNWLSGFTGVLTGASQTVTLATGTTNYKVEGIDANQCRDTFEYSITPVAVPLILAGADRNDVCAGDKVNLWATVNGGLAPYTYTWDGVPADLVVAVAPGVNTYSVTVEDANGCKATTTTGDIVGHQVTLTASAVLPTLPVGGGVSNLTTVATAAPADGAVFTYEWTPGNKLGGAANLASLPTVHLTSQQTYTVTVTDGYACKATTDVTVNVQSETLSAFARGSLVCFNTPATLNAMGLGGSGSYTYNWTGTTTDWKLDNTTIANPTVLAGAPAGSHTFTVTVTDNKDNRKTATATATVTVKALPQVRINGQQNQIANVCEGQTLTLLASAGETTYFKWVKGFSGNGDTRSEIPTENKTYKVIGTTVDGCADTAVYEIKMQKNPSVIVTSPVADLCKGGDVQLTATAVGGSGNYTNYEWADRQTGSQPTVTASVAGDNIYTVTVTDSKGCKATASTTVVGHEVTVATSALKNPVAYDTPATLLATPTFNPSGKEGRVSYSWTNGLSTVVSTSQIATTANLLADETFSVLVTDQYGCTATGSVTINVQAPEGTPLDVNANMKTGTVCIGGSILLSAQAVGGNINAVVPKYTYQWFEKGKTVILANTAAFMPAPTAPVTEYVVQVTDASLPTAKTAYDTVTLRMSTDKAPVANAGLDQTVKKGTVTVLGLASATATQGTKPYTYVWSPAGMLDAGEAVRETPTTVALASDTTYVVYVKDKNDCISLPDEVKVKVADDMFTITAKAAPTQICFANTSQLEVTKVGGTFAAGATFSWSPAANLSNTAIANPVFMAPANVLTPTNYPFTVTVTEGGRSLTTLVSVTVKPGTAPQLQFVGTPHCVGDSVYVKATNAVTVTGTYNWYISDGMPNPKNGKFYEFKASADYDIKVVTTSGNCTSDTLRGVFKIGSKPLVDIQAPRYLVGPRDTVFTFTTNVTPTGTYRYTWKGTLFNPAGGVTGPGGVGATSGSSMTATKLDADVQYVVEAKGIAANSCPAYDTVKVFILPDAPTIDIDTAQDRYHSRIKLAGSDVWATGNTIWSRKWDPYCLTSEDGGKYIKEADLAISKTTWDEPAMDSLEFYYATSYREIAELGGVRYDARGTSKDTVGYKLDSIRMNPAFDIKNGVKVPRTSLNTIAWLFDMPSIQTSEQLFDRIQQSNIDAIYEWAFNSQLFSNQTTPNLDYDPVYDPVKYYGVFDMAIGQVYQFGATKGTVLLQYGKLKSVRYKLEQTQDANMSDLNTVSLPILKRYLRQSDEMFEELTNTSVDALYFWNFEVQLFSNQTTPNFDYDPVYDPIKYYGIVRIYPGLPIQIGFIGSSSVSW